MDYQQQKLIHKQLLLSSTLRFTQGFFQYMNGAPYIVGEHHIKICHYLDKVIKGEIQKLIINIAPRYGKTELVSRMFPAYGFALNPRSLFLHLSYSGSLTLDNSVATKDIIKSKYFQNVFNVEFDRRINSGSKWNTTVGGGEYATSMLGQITGFGAGRVELDYDKDEDKLFDDFTAKYNPNGFSGAIIIDDPIKPDEALSDKIREKVNLRFETTIRNRVNSRKTPIIIIMQRLHEHDLCGYLQEIEPDEWTVLSLPAIMTDGHGNQRALWPFKFTIEELLKIKNANSFVFETQYMQNPTPMEGLMYRPFKTYEILPNRKKAKFIGNVTDPADTGADYLCSICFDAHADGYYVTDILYTKKAAEFTEQAMAQMLCKNETGTAFIESNNGGRLFMRNVERLTREYENRKTRFIPFAQRMNKQVRIFSRANEVSNMLIFPVGWERKWPDFYRDLTSYRKEGVMTHDDCADAVTMVIERCEEWGNYASDEEILRDFL